MKRWTTEHVRLASAVLSGRERPLTIMHRLPTHDQAVVGSCCNVLRHALKARGTQTREAA